MAVLMAEFWAVWKIGLVSTSLERDDLAFLIGMQSYLSGLEIQVLLRLSSRNRKSFRIPD